MASSAPVRRATEVFMGTRDPRIDAYVANSVEFAWPILRHLRAIVRKVCPAVRETLKGMLPHFSLRRNALRHGRFQTALRIRTQEERTCH
jgi:hypothetical protein